MFKYGGQPNLFPLSGFYGLTLCLWVNSDIQQVALLSNAWNTQWRSWATFEIMWRIHWHPAPSTVCAVCRPGEMLYTSGPFFHSHGCSCCLSEFFFIKHMALQPLQGLSSIWCCQLVMLCVKSVKDEKQVRAKFIRVEESNWRTLWSP